MTDSRTRNKQCLDAIGLTRRRLALHRPPYVCPACGEKKGTRRLHGVPQRCHECHVKNRAEWKKEYNARYKLLLKLRRIRDTEVKNAPYPIAVRRIERLTGKPRAEWEWKSAHPLTILALRAAKILAGLEDRAA